MVRRQFKALDKASFLIIYKGFIRPHLEYAIQAWSRRDIDCLEKVQRKATKLVDSFYKVPWRNGDKAVISSRHKILTGKERVDPNCFFTLDKKHYSTRGHELKLYTRRSRLELRKNFFSQRVVTHWNKLPESVVMAETVNTFKNRLDRCNEWGI